MNTKFNLKQWSIASVAVFIIYSLVGFLLRKLGVEPWVTGTVPSLGDAQQYSWTMSQGVLVYLARIFGAGLFTYVFTKGYEGKPGLGEGLRYGLWIGLLVYVPAGLYGFASSIFPVSSQVYQIVRGIVEAIICGGVVAQLYKPVKAS